jgi:hypothetical protein
MIACVAAAASLSTADESGEGETSMKAEASRAASRLSLESRTLSPRHVESSSTGASLVLPSTGRVPS